MPELGREDLELILRMCRALSIDNPCNKCEHSPVQDLVEEVQVSTLETTVRRMLHDK